jgi:signal transduction histidine kinase
VSKKKDGTFYTEEATITPVRDESGAIVNYVSVQRDITRELQLEEQFYQVQKMEAVGRLAGGVAHDFNNILVVITGYSELLLQRHLHDDDPIRKYVEEIKKAGERASGLTQQLLAFSRKQVLQPEVVDLNDLIANMERMLQRLIGEDIDLVVRQKTGLGRVKADPGQLEQIIMNLAVNARDAMPQGGKLTFETANIELDETYTRQHMGMQPGRYVMVAVSDTGVGMDAATQARIFEPFFTTKAAGQGTGLGLATVYGIVKQSGGDVWVYSELGCGTTFKIYLPRVDELGSTVKPEPFISDLPIGTETVLLVEDEEAVRGLARQVLEMSGYTMLEASHGGEALLLAEQQQDAIDLLITDVVMPGGMNGQELAERLKSLRPGIKVLFISGYTDEALVHHGVLEPGLFLLQKPFAPNVLVRKVREVLDTS